METLTNKKVITRVKRAAKGFIGGNGSNEWPVPKVDGTDEPHFVFIITQPYTGSTALAHVLNTAQGSALLHSSGEGQWLVPGMCATDRWDPKKVMRWDSVRATWLYRIETLRELVHVDMVIEKSPPNILRVDQLVRTFPKHALMAFNRDPFAHCSSVLFRHHAPKTKSTEERVEIVKTLAKGWLDRSEWVRKWIQEFNVTHFSYEDFCATPTKWLEALARETPALRTVNLNKGIVVKDYQKQTLENQNTRQVGLLLPEEIAAISGVLQRDVELVRYFGYDPSHPTL